MPPRHLLYREVYHGSAKEEKCNKLPNVYSLIGPITKKLFKNTNNLSIDAA